MLVFISGTVTCQASKQGDCIITMIRKPIGQDVEFYRLSFPHPKFEADSLTADTQIGVSGELSFATEGEKTVPTIRVSDYSFVR